jgi:hypothetical protein
MLNKAYARGVNDALRQAGVVKFASDELANEAADLVGGESLPEEVGEVPPETTAALASNLAELAQALQASADSAGEAAQVAGGDVGGGDMGGGAEGDVAKAASVKHAALWLRKKLAEGALITGADPAQTNDQSNSEDNAAALDESNRPGGEAYANVGVAGVGSQEASGEGAIASETPQEKSMGPVAEQNTNSAIEAVKNAAARQGINIVDLISKLAEGALYMPNATPKADLQNDVSKLEDANRPGGIGYANVGVSGVGNSAVAAAERSSSIGTEQPHPGTMGPVGSPGTNSAIEQTSKSAAEKQYIQDFQAVASKYAAYLPPRLSKSEKIAAIRYMMACDPLNRDKLAMHMSKTAELPPGLAAYVDKEKGETPEEEKKEEECKDEKKDEKPAEEKKEEEAKKEAALRLVRSLMR